MRQSEREKMNESCWSICYDATVESDEVRSPEVQAALTFLTFHMLDGLR